MNKKTKNFNRGIFYAIAMVSLIQDIFFGSAEKYAHHILNGGWTDSAITIPIAIIILVIVYMTRDVGDGK